MGIDDRLAPVELVIDRGEGGIARIFPVVVGENAYAVGLQGPEGVLDFLQAPLHVRQRNSGEEAEAAGMIAHDLRLRVTSFEIDVSGMSVSARFDAASLRVECAVVDGRDAPHALSEGDRRKIERTIQDDVLAARRHPDIRFRSQRASPVS